MRLCSFAVAASSKRSSELFSCESARSAAVRRSSRNCLHGFHHFFTRRRLCSDLSNRSDVVEHLFRSAFRHRGNSCRRPASACLPVSGSADKAKLLRFPETSSNNIGRQSALKKRAIRGASFESEKGLPCKRIGSDDNPGTALAYSETVRFGN